MTKSWKFPVALVLLGLASGCRKEPGTGYVAEAGPVLRPPGLLSAEEAAQYVVRLVNHDRALAGLAPVEWDGTAAKGGLRHATDMAAHGYTAHWGTDGSVPEERYTAAGGTDYVMENAACFFDGKDRALDPAPQFTAVDLEKIEGAFMSEVPPNDGHKRNILTPSHRKLGVGLAKPNGIPEACMSQEFVDDYGEYGSLPARARVGSAASVTGEIASPAKFAGIGVARIDAARPMSAAELGATSVYAIPKPFVLYSPPGFVTPKPVRVDGNHFALDVPLTENGKAGRYEISVWATLPGDPKLVMVSLRVIDVH